ncbi:MAG: antitoxin Xre/MbcA/ParS toxin-binding domain-containing protein, partial [Candidatus Dormibacteraceae bacterium]
ATPLVRERADFLVQLIGGAELARWLRVSRSQPTRWRTGAEQPSVEAARELVDLDHVMTRALMLWTPRVATDWFTSANAYLDGARPIDVLRIRGSAEVIDALDAVTSGAYA